MAIQPNKPQNRVFLLVGIVLAAAAAVAVLFTISRSGSNVPTTNVVVAKSAIPAGTSITADLLTTAALPQASFPADALTDPAQAVGKTAPVAVSQNTPITAALLATTVPSIPGQVAIAHLDITKGYVALAIPAAGGTTGFLTADQTAVGFYIQPEDHIDIIIDPATGGQPSSARYAFQDVRVLRVGAANAAANAPVTVYIVELPRNQAEIITALITDKSATPRTILKYVLRPQSEWGKRDPNNGFDKPNYESNAGQPLNLGADTTVTPDTLNKLFR